MSSERSSIQTAIAALVIIGIIVSASSVFYVMSLSNQLAGLPEEIGNLAAAESDLATELGKLATAVGESVAAIEDIQTRLENVEEALKEPLPGSLEAIEEAGKIKVATAADYPPWEFYDEEGQITGFDIELMEEIGKEMGVIVEWHDMDWDVVIASIETHKTDVIIGSMSITEKRLQVVDFTDSYFTHTYVIATKKGSGVTMESWEDLANYTVGCQSGTIQLDDVNATLIAPGLLPLENLIPYPRMDTMVLDLDAGRVDTAYINKMAFISFKETYPDLEIVWERTPPAVLGTGIALSKDRPDLKFRLNQILAALDHSGVMAQLKEKWFGFS